MILAWRAIRYELNREGIGTNGTPQTHFGILGSKRYLRETMQLRRRFVFHLVAGAATLVSAFPVTRSGMAQVWPTRPLTMVVPYAAGGPVDTIGRVTAAGLRQVVGPQAV